MIRRMKEEDLAAVDLLEKDLFPQSPWSSEAYLRELKENPFAILAVYEEDETIKGYCDLWITYDNAQLANIGVAREAWGKGIGSALMDWCLERARENKCGFITLEVRVSNQRAIRLYEKFGFIQAGLRKNYYENGENAYLMVLAAGGDYDDDDIGD